MTENKQNLSEENMEKVRLGRTGIIVNKNSFGALPIQRVDKETAKTILRHAYDNGFELFDTAYGYTDSEEKLGYALSDVRKNIIITTKTPSTTVEGFWSDLETSLKRLKTDYIDVYQFHNPKFVPKPGGADGLYDAMLEAKKQGKIRFIGITNHRLDNALEAVNSGLYDTLQFPFCYLAGDKDIELIKLCEEKDMGVLAMKALSGGLITNAKAAYAFIAQFKNVAPIWGIQRMTELEEFISYGKNPPVLDAELQEIIAKDRAELIGNFCRACGYCLPCPAEINIPTAARMSLLLRRAPSAKFLEPAMQEEMNKIENCIGCGNCTSHCPYSLNTPELLRKNLEDYRNVLAKKVSVD